MYIDIDINTIIIIIIIIFVMSGQGSAGSRGSRGEDGPDGDDVSFKVWRLKLNVNIIFLQSHSCSISVIICEWLTRWERHDRWNR